MTASHRCNKNRINQRKKSNYFRTLYKSNSNSFENFIHYKKLNNFESPRTSSLSLMNKKKKEIIIEWCKGDKEIIYLTLSFGYLEKFFNDKNKEEMVEYSKLNYMHQKLNFRAIGKIRIYSIFLLTRSLFKTEKNNKSINSKNQSASTRDQSSIFTSDNNINNKNIDFSFSKKNYCNYYPKINEMKEIADKKPSHFPTECFIGVNRSHNEIGKKEYLNLIENSVFNSNNDSYKIIDKKDHVLLNHLCQFDTKNKNIINSISIRYRHKNTTFIYYK